MMLININVKNLVLNEDQSDYIQRRVQFALGRFVSRIRRVSAIFSDINGTRGGVDKKCQLQIALIPNGEIVVEDVDTTVESAVANASERASRTIARFLDRMRAHKGPAERATVHNADEFRP